MASIDLRVVPQGETWTVRGDRTVFERFERMHDALRLALRQATALRRAGHEVRVRLTPLARPGMPRLRRPRDGQTGDLACFVCPAGWDEAAASSERRAA